MKYLDVDYSIISKYRKELMGCSIVFILIFHYCEDCVRYNINLGGLSFFYKFIFTSSVDLFFLLSGYGLFFSLKNNPSQYKFYKRHFFKIFIPYTIVSFPFFVWKYFITRVPNIIQFFKAYTFITFLLAGDKVYWFIFALLFFYLIFPYLYYVFSSENNRVKLFYDFILICFSYLLLIYILRTTGADKIYNNLSIMLLRFPSFVLGTYIGKLAIDKKRIPLEIILIVGIIFLFNVIQIFIFNNLNKSMFHTYFLLINNISVCTIVILFLKLLDNRVIFIRKFLLFLGDLTLEIYLTHIAIRAIFNYYKFYTYNLLNECIMIVISLVVSLGLKKISFSVRSFLKLI